MGVDIGKPGLDLGDAMGVGCRFRFFEEACPLDVGGEDGIEQRFRSARCFLGHRTDARIARQRDAAGLGLKIAEDDMQKGGLAHAVAADEANLVAVGNRDRGILEEKPPGNPVGESVDVQAWRGAF